MINLYLRILFSIQIENRVILSRIIPHGLRKRQPTTNVDARSHILNEPERTSLLGSQVYFGESDLGLKKLNIFLVKF